LARAAKGANVAIDRRISVQEVELFKLTSRSLVGAIRTAAAISSVLWLAACAGYGPGSLAPGANVAAITEKMGRPTGEYRMPDGTRRLEYARGPAGLHTFMLDLDANGNLKSSEQVLDEKHFGQIKPGMSKEELLRTIGRPGEMRSTAMTRLDFWNYHYDNVFCTMFQVDIDGSGTVRGAGFGPDPRCNRDVPEPSARP
jgi:hypothetical protein